MIRGKISNNKFIPHSKAVLLERLQELNEKEVELHIREARSKRSNNQNSYLHGVIIPMIRKRLEELGYTSKQGTKPTNLDTKELLKSVFLKDYITDKEGSEIEFTKSTASLNTQEAEEFFEEVRDWAHRELDLTIPLPNEDPYNKSEIQ